jgi:hypothetical protein
LDETSFFQSISYYQAGAGDNESKKSVAVTLEEHGNALNINKK